MTFKQFATQRQLTNNIHQWINLILPSFDHGNLLPLFQPALYLQSLTTLNIIFYLNCNHHLNTWKKRLQNININPTSYTPQFHRHPFVTYVKISHLQAKTYVGETYKGVHERELTRRRKLKQLNCDRNASCELALHYWKNTNTYHKFATIVTHNVQNSGDTKLQELSNISIWQPQLNPPIVQKILKTNKYVHSTSFNIRRTHNITRTWRKTRNLAKRFQLKSTDIDKHNNIQHQRLHCLSNPGLKQFHSQKLLRQPKLSTALELYALARQAPNLTEPQRSTATKQLKLIFKHRNLKFPNFPAPLIIPFLHHSTFRHKLQTFLRLLIRNNSTKALPLHLPPYKPIEGKHQTLAETLFSWKKHYTNFTTTNTSTCNCKNFITKHPNIPTFQEHVVCTLDKWPDITPQLYHITTANAKDTFYPSKQFFTKVTTTLFQAWTRKNNFNIQNITKTWEQFIEDEWPQHLQAAKDTYQFGHITQLKKLLSDWVVHCEDHAPYKFVVYCPKTYINLIQSTFDNTDVFTQQPISPTHLQNIFPSLFPSELKQQYTWGMQFSKPLAHSYIFPKRKKQFTNARPIISFANTPTSTLLKGLSHTLIAITKIVFPHQFHQHDIATTFRLLHKFLSLQISNLNMHNDDLTVFFTSVPHDRIITAVTYAIDRYRALQPPQHNDPITFSVQPKSKCKLTRFIRGRSFRRTGKSHIIYLDHLEQLITFTLKHSYFTSLGKVYKQKRGSCIGSPLSPALCNMTVAFEEHIWFNTYNTHITRTTFCTRYVDNRLILILPSTQDTEPFQVLVNLDFYQDPVTLEPELCNKFLGFNVDHKQHTCTYIVPEHDWQYRSFSSAGSSTSILSGLASRLHIIKRGTYPQVAVPPESITLLNKYKDQGFTTKALVQIAKKVFPKISGRNLR